MAKLSNSSGEKKKEIFAQLLPLFKKTESYDLLALEQATPQFDYNLFETVWSEASEMRKQGVFQEILARVQIPVTFIHGVVDPHPSKDIKDIVDKNHNLFKLITLEKCGHTPWEERQASEIFHKHLLCELNIIG